MANKSARQFRRSAAQLHALASVERTISANDSVSRCRYLKDYSRAFQTYQSVLGPGELADELRRSDIILVGDYHALSASQAYAASLIEQLSSVSRRPILFCLEAILGRDQKILDEWFRAEIDSEELRERVRFDADWGYDWRPYRDLLETARRLTAGVFGIDCPPRSDMRTIARRDRHAAAKIAQLRKAHPEAIIVVLFGESHLAPTHLPELLRAEQSEARILTVLQNVDKLYWQAVGEPGETVGAVRVQEGVICAFTSTPLEKYENYRLYIEQWRRERSSTPDMAPSFYNLIETLARFLNLKRLGIQFAPENLPEVSCTKSTRLIRKRLTRVGVAAEAVDSILRNLRLRGSRYVYQVRTIFALRFLMPEAAEEAARFVHHACQGEAWSCPGNGISSEDEFYIQVIEEAVSYLGSKILCPGRVVTCVPDAATRLGQTLASRIYEAYVAGTITKSSLRSLFCTSVREPGAARDLYFTAVWLLKHPRTRARSTADRPSPMVS